VNERRYRVVDVFTTEPLEGNPLAVFPDAAGISGETMQRIAAELNLAETAFVLPPTRGECAARVRIFTPKREMPFAGHPTIGTSFVLFDEGAVPGAGDALLLEEGVGPVAVRIESGARPRIWLRTPPIQEGPAYDRALCAEVLGLPESDLLEFSPAMLSAGNPTLYIPLRSRDAVDRAWAELAGMRRLRLDGQPLCAYVFTPEAGGAYARMFAPEYGVPEDPATGSSAGPLAAYMMRHALAAAPARLVVEQGVKMGRRSLLHVSIHAEGIDVGGYVTPVAEGTLRW